MQVPAAYDNPLVSAQLCPMVYHATEFLTDSPTIFPLASYGRDGQPSSTTATVLRHLRILSMRSMGRYFRPYPR